MSSPRDDQLHGGHGKARRSTPGPDHQSSGLFQTGYGGRPVLPPISSAFPTSCSPAPSQYHNQYLQQRSSQARNEFNVAPYAHQWFSNTPSQQHLSSFGYYETHDPRYGATQYPSARASTSLPNDPYDSRRLPPVSTASARREEECPTSPFTAHMPFSDEICSPTASYPSQNASHHMPQQGPFSYLPTPSDNRNIRFPAASYNQQSQMYIGQQPLAERVGVSRGKDAHPYGRPSSTSQSMGYGAEPVAASTQEPTIKQKRERADAAQLNVLNETYQRTTFPSAEERGALATELDMPPQSIQRWFQNKRKSDPQSSRRPSSAIVTSGLSDEAPAVSVSSYGSDTPSMSPTNVEPMYFPRSSRDPSQHRVWNQEGSDDPRNVVTQPYNPAMPLVDSNSPRIDARHVQNLTINIPYHTERMYNAVPPQIQQSQIPPLNPSRVRGGPMADCSQQTLFSMLANLWRKACRKVSKTARLRRQHRHRG